MSWLFIVTKDCSVPLPSDSLNPNTGMYPQIIDNEQLAPQSKVWIYTASRPLTEAETELAQQELDRFTAQWTAHNQALQARAEVFAQQLAILVVDETRAGASGCSIDKSVHFLQDLGQRIGVDFFDRMRFGWMDGDKLRFNSRDELAAFRAASNINDDTAMLNTLAPTLSDLRDKWLLPLGQSWHKRLI